MKIVSAYVNFIFIVVSLLGCNKIEYTNKNIKVSFALPLVTKNGEVHYHENDFSIFYLRDKIVYELPYNYTGLEDSIPHIEFKYFIFSKNKSKGIVYRPSRNVQPKILKVDSVLKAEAFYKMNFVNLNDLILYKTLDYPDYSKEIYTTKLKKDISYPDTTIIHYSNKDLDIEYCLSEDLEKIKNKKILRIESFFNPCFENNVYIQKRRFAFEIKEIESLSQKQVKIIEEINKKFEIDSKEIKD